MLGRVIEAWREETRFYQRTAGRVRRECWLAWGRHVLGTGWEMARRLKKLWLGLLVMAFLVPAAWAAVTVTDFVVEPAEGSIFIFWETASETGNRGFYIWRSLDELNGYEDISGFIPGEDEEGAYYEYEDLDVSPGILYYYKLQDVPDDDSEEEFFGPVFTGIDLTPTATGTVTATSTPTPSVTPTPVPTATPHPNVSFWATKTELEAGECTVVQWVTNNVQTVFLDGQGVVGEGSQTFCPCVTETHVLYVSFPTGGAEEFELTLTVSGTCSEETPEDDSPEATLTATVTPFPTPTSSGDVTSASPTATQQPLEITQVGATDTPRSGASPTAAPTDAVPALMPTSPLPTAAMASPQIVGGTPTRIVVEGESQQAGVTKLGVLVVIFVLGTVLGLGFIGSGIWLWRRQQ